MRRESSCSWVKLGLAFENRTGPPSVAKRSSIQSTGLSEVVIKMEG